MKANIEISDKNLTAISGILNNLLADEYVLYTKTRNAHWNVEGANFAELHQFFEGQYKALDVIIDETAERIRMLGHYSLGSLHDFLSITRLSEKNNTSGDQKQIIKALLDDHETILRILRKEVIDFDKYKEPGTTDFLTNLLKQHEKMAWMLRAYLS